MKKGNVIFFEGRILLYYMIFFIGRKLVDFQGDFIVGILKVIVSEVRFVE